MVLVGTIDALPLATTKAWAPADAEEHPGVRQWEFVNAVEGQDGAELLPWVGGEHTTATNSPA